MPFFRVSRGATLAWLLLCVSVAVAEEAEVSVSAVDDDAVTAAIAQPDKYDWAATGYVAWLSGDQFGDMLIFNASLSDNKIAVAALTRRITTFRRDVDWEVEGQIGRHIGGDSDMDHWEVNALTSLRWNRFSWDNSIDTSVAMGVGLSYAFEKPVFEIEEHDTTNRMLVYLLVELAFSIPKHPQWALVTRIHHRSSAYGTFEDDIEGASNSLGIGLQYRF